jgi:lipoprotein-releasing system ATP-binding protein
VNIHENNILEQATFFKPLFQEHLTMLRGENLVKSYGSLTVLKGVSIEIGKAEITAIVGASGAGKSTLLHILGTLDTPDQGQVFLEDKQVFAQSREELADFRNQYMGFVFQFHNLLPEFSALENVMIPGLIGKRREADVRKKAIELLTLLGLKDRVNHKPSQLSGGEQQRTAVARALVNAPKLVFADEPSGNLDSRNANELHELFLNLRKEFGFSFVIVTHNLTFASMADRTLEMKDGLLVKSIPA